MARAPALPGVVSYLNKIRDLGIEPVLITNRREYLLGKTIENLQKVGIIVNHNYILGRGKNLSKEFRRRFFLNKCNIIQLIGAKRFSQILLKPLIL